ncbi:MAG: NAD(P)H-dependent glycerol-3-phosphate dehydrogenase [Clostridiales bacterium]|nr:NAD(P)H-dependent glycerol-3-phosphate dehydrogenase [Clostridiales bacterium]
MDTIGVVGAGSWGTALAVTLAGKGHEVKIWDVDDGHLRELIENKENKRYLPGVPFNEKLTPTGTLEETLEGVGVAIFSAPAQRFRSALLNAMPFLRENMVVVNVAKGIEQKTLKRMSEIASELIPGFSYAVLSGPSHAEEVGRFMPTTVAVASADVKVAEYVQDVFMTDRFRVYTNHDVAGVEFGGSLKNIIALGAGISDGMGYGDNAKAAMMTRGIAEMARLGVKLGADRRTFSGLTGIGDLIVTCTSMHSRNRRCGVMIGEGASPEEAVKRVGMVVEGMFTTEAAYELAEEAGVEMPITESIYGVVNGKTLARDAVDSLMGRNRKHESE